VRSELGQFRQVTSVLFRLVQFRPGDDTLGLVRPS
jgi:hypothetical protein